MLNGGYLGSLWITKKLSLTCTFIGREGGFEPPASASRTLKYVFSTPPQTLKLQVKRRAWAPGVACQP